MRTCSNTFIRYIVNVVVSLAGCNACPVIGEVLDVVALRTDVHTHLHIGIGVSKHLIPIGRRTVSSTQSIDWISISICWTTGSINTMIHINCLIDEGIVGTGGDTFMLGIGECVVGVVVGRAGGHTGSC